MAAFSDNILVCMARPLMVLTTAQANVALTKAWQEVANGNASAQLLKGEAVQRELALKTSNDSTIWLSAIFNPIFGVDGKLTKVAMSATDITGQRNTLERIRAVVSTINGLANCS